MNSLPSIDQLLQKYDVPAPRYTSYPTVPYWDFTTLNEDRWKQQVKTTFREDNREISIYIHLPFCENLCTFCACTKRITKNHAVEDPYIETVLKEWSIYRELFEEAPVIKEVHLGGGTPTFFSAANLERLITGIASTAIIAQDKEFSIEVHPNFTTEEHLKVLAALGFNRISVGVQDFDPKVQQAINRVQSFETTKEVVDRARKYGYHSINTDLVYGLPFQTPDSIEYTISKIKQLMPDRIAFYSYAHVPWKSKVQRRYSEEDLPTAGQKLTMYSAGKQMLLDAGYRSIGMDHFALPADPLFVAAAEKRMNRNFMGYTTTRSKLIVALGASSISDAWGAFAQNEKTVEDYSATVQSGRLPIVNGHLLHHDDLLIRQHILDLMCHQETRLKYQFETPGFITDVLEGMQPFAEDGLVSVDQNLITVTEKGKTFIRNICTVLDARLRSTKNTEAVFSKAI